MRALVAATLLAFACSLAHANPPGATPPVMIAEIPPAPAQPAPSGVKSYRMQTLAADGIAVALLFVAVDQDEVAYAKLSLGTYLFGAPLVHLTKDRSGRALASLTMRIGFPILGGMLGDSMRPRAACADYDLCDSEEPSDELVLGVLAGLIAASAVDSIYLAKGDAPKPQPSWTPVARSTNGGFALGVRGRF